MEAAPPPPEEEQRLAELHALRILDTDETETWDRIVRIASQVCGMPIALVSLIDEHRQWFKARVGLAARETPRDQAFCAHAIHDDAVLEVPDTHEDVRFHDNPLVTDDPSIRFYAGIPIHGPGGHRLGTVCVIDRVPRRLDDEQRSALRDLGALAEELLRVRAAALRLQQLEADADHAAQHHGQRAINHVSHELGTPLTPLRLGLGTLRRRLHDRPDDLACLDRMERNVDRIAGVIHDATDALRPVTDDQPGPPADPPRTRSASARPGRRTADARAGAR